MPKLWKDPKPQQDWSEKQSGLTINSEQSATIEQQLKKVVKNQHYIPLHHTPFSIFLYICIVFFLFHFF